MKMGRLGLRFEAEAEAELGKETDSLSDTKLAKDHIEQIFGGGFAYDFADGIDGNAQVQSYQFERLPGPQSLCGLHGSYAGALQSVLMARVNHDLEHLGLDLARPNQILDGIFEIFYPLATKAGDRDGA